MIGLNKKQIEINNELVATISRLDEFSKEVERTLDEANSSALSSLQERIEDLVLHAVKANLSCPAIDSYPPTLYAASLGSLVEEALEPCAPSPCLPRGRSRERFCSLQQQLVSRARSISSDRELRSIISDAKKLAALERITD